MKSRVESSVVPAINPPGGVTTVVLVEDDATVRQLLPPAINQTPGFTCVGAFASAEEALPELPRLKPAIVLTDINLPGSSGVDLVREMKPRLPDTHFIMLTMYADSDHIFSALAAGADGYLLKRYVDQELASALGQVRDGGSPMSCSIARMVVESFRSGPKTEEYGLSARENEVLEKLASGFLFKEIADAMGISSTTVSTYARRIYRKLHVCTRAQAIAVVNGRPVPGVKPPR